MRNVLIHAYARTDHERVWLAATVSIPALAARVTALLRELDPPP